ncbi:MAG TPA: ABC transporter permease [Marmoricola sp.]|jgi:lipooligosaccharide transport system permease protein|nr:ABC transporter permease [Marmoricola sp.]
MASVSDSPVSTAPAGILSGAARLTDYWLVLYRRTWKGSVISSFIVPLLYILAMGVLLGGFIKGDPAKLDGATSYLAFVAPGMLAAQAMTTVFGEVTYPVMGMIKWQRIYDGMIATPLTIREIVLSHLGFVTFRVGTVSAVFILVMAPFGVFESVTGVVLAFFVQLLMGLAFATPIYALSATMRDESAFALVFRLGMIPMFLFSGAFFPISNLSTWMEWLARVTPLWHAVDLTRGLVLGNVDASMALVHVGYLAVFAVLGWLLVVRQLERRLVT